MCRVIVCGGRKFGVVIDRNDRNDRIRAQAERSLVTVALDRLHRLYGFTVVIEGGASGADSLAWSWALDNGVPTVRYYADWSKGKAAGIFRNIKMLQEGKPDLVVAFQGGTGTAHMVKIARQADIEVITP